MRSFTASPANRLGHLMVADRFMVKVTADQSNLLTLKNAAQLIPMPRLATALATSTASTDLPLYGVGSGGICSFGSRGSISSRIAR